MNPPFCVVVTILISDKQEDFFMAEYEEYITMNTGLSLKTLFYKHH